VERIVTQKQEADGYPTLTKMGCRTNVLRRCTWHPDAFSAEAVAQSREARRGGGAAEPEPSVDAKAKG
jgi:hypothetical protein